MIKLNDICIQYTAWCRRDTATSLTHTPWSTRLGPARSQHRKSDETVTDSSGIDPRNGIGESEAGGKISLSSRYDSLVKIKNRSDRSMRIPSPDARVERSLESQTRRRVSITQRHRAA